MRARRSTWGSGNNRMEFIGEFGEFDLWWDADYKVVTVVEVKHSDPSAAPNFSHNNQAFVDIDANGEYTQDNGYRANNIPMPVFPPEVLIAVYAEYDRRSKGGNSHEVSDLSTAG